MLGAVSEKQFEERVASARASVERRDISEATMKASVAKANPKWKPRKLTKAQREAVREERAFRKAEEAKREALFAFERQLLNIRAMANGLEEMVPPRMAKKPMEDALRQIEEAILKLTEVRGLLLAADAASTRKRKRRPDLKAVTAENAKLI
jgi:hypothetical protein